MMIPSSNLYGSIGAFFLLNSAVYHLGTSDAFLVQQQQGRVFGIGSSVSKSSAFSTTTSSRLLKSSLSSTNTFNHCQRKGSIALQAQSTNITFDSYDDLQYGQHYDYYYSSLDRSQFMIDLEEQLSQLKTLQQQQQEHLQHDAMQVETAETTENGKVNLGFMTISELWKARLLLIGAAALYGTNFSLVKLLGDTMPVGVSSTLRFGLAALSTMPFLVGNINKDNKDSALMSAWLGFEVGMWTSIGYVAQAVGLETTPASESAFICSLAVVTVPLLDWIAGKKLLPKQWMGAILAVVGVAFLELGDIFASSAASGTAVSMTTGDLLSLVQPFAFGMGFWRMEHAMQRFPNEASRLTAAQLLAVFCSSLTYGLWAIDLPTLESFPWAEWFTSPELLFSLFWTGVITTAMTIYMETLAMKTLSAAETTLIFSTEPLWGTAFAACVMGEELGINVAVGATFILTACLYSNLGVDGIQKLLKGRGNGGDKDKDKNKLFFRRPIKVRDLPAALQQQWIWFTSSMTASWATWSVTPNSQKLEQIQDALEDFFSNTF